MEYISNNKIESLKPEKIVDKDLHADTIEEKIKLEKILREIKMFDKLTKPVSDIVGKFVKDKDLQAQLDHELATLFHQANLAK